MRRTVLIGGFPQMEKIIKRNKKKKDERNGEHVTYVIPMDFQDFQDFNEFNCDFYMSHFMTCGVRARETHVLNCLLWNLGETFTSSSGTC